MRRYITPARERIDDICRQDATIVDCASRTVTTLDLRQRRFARYALDDVYDDGLASIAADSNGSQVTSTTHVERGAHGTTILDGTRVQEYTFVQTQATTSSSMSIVTRDSWTYDFSSSPLPTLTCLDVGAPWLSRYGWPWRYAPELQRFFADRQEKLASLTGSRFQISVNGAPLPDWRIPRYALGEHAQTQSGAPSFTYHFLLESGNVRTIRDDDPVFTVPKDFTAMRL
jgi:hypothetical protein